MSWNLNRLLFSSANNAALVLWCSVCICVFSNLRAHFCLPAIIDNVRAIVTLTDSLHRSWSSFSLLFTSHSAEGVEYIYDLKDELGAHT